MGILLAINVPVEPGVQRLAALSLGVLALAGLAVMSVGRLAKVNDSGDDGSPRAARAGEPP